MLLGTAAHCSVTAGSEGTEYPGPGCGSLPRARPHSSPTQLLSPLPPQDAAAPQDQAGTTEGCMGARFGSGGYREREAKTKGRRNEPPEMKAIALMLRSAHFTPCRQPALLLPSLLPPTPLGRASTLPPQRGENSIERMLDLPSIEL